MEGADVEMMDVSDMLDSVNNRVADAVLERMGEAPTHNWKEIDKKAQYLSPFVMSLRTRYNNREGPFLIKTEEPIDLDMLTTLVRNPEMMARFRKEALLYRRTHVTG